MNEKELASFAINELASIDIIDTKEVIDYKVIKAAKSYPAYFGSYHEFEHIKKYTDQFSNLFLIGRNGMHKYNNQDHSMLTAMEAVKNIINFNPTKENIWKINTEQEYHEEASK